MIGFNNNYNVTSDKKRFQQVLLNLQSNAIKFTERGGRIDITVKLVVQNQEEGLSKIETQVEDTGVGIRPQDLSKLFKMFGMLKSTKNINTNGIGLGLFICKQIVH